MNSRKRFRQTMAYGEPDRVPLFAEGIRKDVIASWRQEGLPQDKSFAEVFRHDGRCDIAPELEPKPWLTMWSGEVFSLETFERRLDPDDPERLPASWADDVRGWSSQEDTIMLRVHRGLYQTLGVTGWQGFEDVNFLFKDDPKLVHEVLEIQAKFAVQMMERILSEVAIDAAVFSEPISDNNGPLISARMFEEFGCTSYQPLLEALRRHGVELIIFRTYANARILVPVALKWGFNCLWACEENLGAMDYGVMRHEFGRDLRLIGGIDVDILRQDQEQIRREVMDKVPPLLSQGGYVPLADGRIRANVPYENYVFYRGLLEEVVQENN